MSSRKSSLSTASSNQAIFGEPAGRTQAIYLKGINVRRFVPDKANTILTRRADGGTGIVAMKLEPAASETEAKALAQRMADSIDRKSVV